MEPIAALNELALDNAGRLLSLQFDVACRLSTAVIEQCRQLAEVKDLDDMQTYLARQPETLKSMADAASKDVEIAARIGMEYYSAAGDILSASLPTAA